MKQPEQENCGCGQRLDGWLGFSLIRVENGK